jgi:hypothetical protein
LFSLCNDVKREKERGGGGESYAEAHRSYIYYDSAFGSA